jgi:lipoprotein
MDFKKIFFALPLMVSFISCSSDSDPIVESVTYGDYELSCVESATKRTMADTLFLSPLAGSTEYDMFIRRKVLSNATFKGEYEYVRPSDIRVSCGSETFSVDFKPGDDGRIAGFTLSAPENRNFDNPVLSSVTFSFPDAVLSMPVKQNPAEIVVGDDYFILHPDCDKRAVYLDNKGDTIDFQCALASTYYINGNKVPDLFWCDEEASFSYELAENEWIRVLDCTPDKDTDGMYVLRIESVADVMNGDHSGVLKLSFTLNGKTYSKDVQLISTEVYHVDWN